MSAAPVFVDCYDDPADRFTDRMRAIVPGLDVLHGPADDEDELIARIQGRRHVLAFMAYMSGRVLRACPDLRTIAYLATGLATHAVARESSGCLVLVHDRTIHLMIFAVRHHVGGDGKAI